MAKATHFRPTDHIVELIRRTKATLYELSLLPSGERRRFQYFREYLQSQYLGREEIERLQFRKLKNLLQHAMQNCEFYRSRFKAARFSCATSDRFTEFASIRPTTKTEIQDNLTTLVAANWSRRDLFENFTGGSTGQPLKFYCDGDRLESRAGATMRHDNMAGLRCGDRLALIWGASVDAPRPSLKHRIRRLLGGQQLWLDTGKLKVEEFREYNLRLTKFRPDVILAYANSLSMFAQFLKNNHILTCTPKAIITSAEILSDGSRNLIQDTFHCPVFNRYGCREVGVIASECEFHCGMHVMAEGLYVEIVNESGEPVGVGEEGDILVTDLLNYGMPLIRYRIGDRGTWGATECKCGRGLPLLAAVNGRVTDFIRGADGRLISGVFLATYVIAQRPSLGHVQIVQRKNGTVTYRIRPGRDFDTEGDTRYLAAETLKYAGPIGVEFEFVDEIPREPSGKLLFCKSELA